MTASQFKFSGEWKFDFPLAQFSKLQDLHWYSRPNESSHYSKLNKGLVPIEIVDRRDDDPDPMDCQLNTLFYLRDNETEVVKALYKAVKEIINPEHVGYSGDDWLKPLNSVKDLGKTIRLDQIQIQLDEKDGVSYYALMCEYIGDYEHGLVITMYKDEYIGSAGSWEVDYEGIAKHRGGYSEVERTTNMALSNSGEDLLHLPHEKYGKLKPWQIDANGSYLSRLMKDHSNNDMIINYIERGDLDVNIPISSYWGDGLVGLANYSKNDFLLNYFLDNGASVGKLIFAYTDNNFNQEKLDYFLSKGADIDTFNFYGHTILFDAINKYCSAHIRTFRVRDDKLIEELRGSMKKKQEQIEYLLSKGADPEKCNTSGQGYRTILTKSWGSYKDDYNSIDEVDKIIYGEVQSPIAMQESNPRKSIFLDWIKRIFSSSKKE